MCLNGIVVYCGHITLRLLFLVLVLWVESRIRKCGTPRLLVTFLNRYGIGKLYVHNENLGVCVLKICF